MSWQAGYDSTFAGSAPPVSSLSGLSFRCVATPCHTRGHVCFFLDADDGQAGCSCMNAPFGISCRWNRKRLPGTRALFRRRSFRSRLRPVYGRRTLFRGREVEVQASKIFEGTALSMRRTLHALAALPKNTRLFCGHEYTVPSCGTWDRLSACPAARLFRTLRKAQVGNLEYALSLEPSSNLLKDRLDAAKAKRAEGLPTVPSTLSEAPAGTCGSHVTASGDGMPSRSKSTIPSSLLWTPRVSMTSRN